MDKENTGKYRYWKWILIVLLVVWTLKNFWIESYRIPSGQMEECLLEGDNLFVNKWSYGLRLPIAPFGIPFCHDSLPGNMARSYLASLTIPYCRLFAQDVRRNDIVIFNHPIPSSRKIPIDRRKITISRCVGLPGDTVKFENGILYINNKLVSQSPLATEAYLYPDSLDKEITTTMKKHAIADHGGKQRVRNQYLRFFSRYDFFLLQNNIKYKKLLQPVHLRKNNFTIILPRPKELVRITAENINLLYPLIAIHENKNVERKGDTLYIEGKKSNFYRFMQPYYWMLSDNRELSTDSRQYGAVPQSHLIGKASRIWLSTDSRQPFYKSLRTNRILLNAN